MNDSITWKPNTLRWLASWERISETLAYPERVVRSKTDTSVELFYKHYPTTPVSEKFLCIVVNTFRDENFVVTAYYTDRIKGGDLLWEKK